MTHRYYDPAEGRFLTRDPIGYSGGLNLYAYCANNPVNWADPLGNYGYQPIGGNGDWLGQWIPGHEIFEDWGAKTWNPNISASDFACKSILPLGFLTAAGFAGLYAGETAIAEAPVIAKNVAVVARLSSRYIKGIPSYFRYIKGNLKINPYRKEIHHLLPRQFKPYFDAAELDIDNYTIELFRYEHVLKKGIHPNGYNKDWKIFFNQPTTDPKVILKFLDFIKKKYGL